ncbi:MAG: DUF885 family protein [Clostridiales bacterium]|nr:DUF885 family protein [Clostridiales bacterium]
MKRYSAKFIALFLTAAMLFSLTSCSAVESLFDIDHKDKKERDKDDDDDEGGWLSKKDDDDDEDDGDDEDDPDDTEDTDPTSDPDDVPDYDFGDLPDLTYPDHIPTQDEIHPDHAPGDVTGQEASDLLDEVESETIQRYIGGSYVNAVLYFEDPSAWGIETDEPSWGEISYDSTEDLEFIDEELEKLYSIDYENLDDQDRIFYDRVTSDFELSKYMMSYTAFMYYEPVFNPLTGPQNDVLFLLTVLDFDTVEDAENYIELLRDIDRYYDELCEFEERRAVYGFASSPEVYEATAETFDDLVDMAPDCFLYDTFEERLDNIDGLTDQQRTDLIDEHTSVMQDVVFPEFQECADRMRALETFNGSDQGMSSYEGGEAYFTALFEDQTDSSVSIEESITRLDNYLDYISDTIDEIANSGDYSWVNTYLYHSYSMGDTQANLDYLETAIADDFPSIPEHSYSLMEVPEAFQDSFSPAAYLAYHLENNDSNMILTNMASDDPDLGITIAHEGYPGHMFQSLYHRSICEHPYMYIFAPIAFEEGWATYIENYAYKYFDEPNDGRDFIMIENELNVVIMARCDIGINYENWTIDDVADLYSDIYDADVTADDVQDLYNLLVSDPCYAIKYGCGFINTGYTMEQIRSEFPDATDLEIFTAYLNAQPGTFENIEEHMRTELGS